MRSSGTLGEAPQVTAVVNSVEQVKALKVPDPDRVAYLTQTTLSLDEARDIIIALKERFPNIKGPQAQDIVSHGKPPGRGEGTLPASPTWCWSWVRRTARIRTAWSRWRETWGTSAYLIDTYRDIDRQWSKACGRSRSRRAPPPEVLVQRRRLSPGSMGFPKLEKLMLMPENVRFCAARGNRRGHCRAPALQPERGRIDTTEIDTMEIVPQSGGMHFRQRIGRIEDRLRSAMRAAREYLFLDPGCRRHGAGKLEAEPPWNRIHLPAHPCWARARNEDAAKRRSARSARHQNEDALAIYQGGSSNISAS